MIVENIVYSNKGYKDILKCLIDLDKNMTNKELARRVPIQPTYLSKIFNDANSHLKDETLYRVGKILGLNDQDVDHLILNKSYECSENPQRKEYLLKKLQAQNKKYLNGVEKVDQGKRVALESMYLLNPKCMLIQLALFIQEYRENPRLLCGPLSISQCQLVETLDLIESNGHIVRGKDPLDIVEVKEATFHIANHELMRIHQNLFKTLVASRLQETHESDKKSFNAVFNMDERAFQKTLELFEQFINDVKDIKCQSRPRGVYQLSFDFFKWL